MAAVVRMGKEQKLAPDQAEGNSGQDCTLCNVQGITILARVKELAKWTSQGEGRLDTPGPAEQQVGEESRQGYTQDWHVTNTESCPSSCPLLTGTRIPGLSPTYCQKQFLNTQLEEA